MPRLLASAALPLLAAAPVAWSADRALRGAAADIDLLRRIGFDLADGSDWPEWRAGSKFRAIRVAARR